MRIGVIGRGRWMFQTLELLIHSGYDVPLVLTSKAPEDYDIKSMDFKRKADEIGARLLKQQIYKMTKLSGLCQKSKSLI